MEKRTKIIISSVVGLTLLGMAFGEDTEKENKSKAIDNKTNTEIKQNVNNINDKKEEQSVENSSNNNVDSSNKTETNDKPSDKNNVSNSSKDDSTNKNVTNNNQTQSQNKNEVQKQETQINNSNSSNSSTNNSSNSSEQLPLKAICNDRTISYQDDASKSDYRGMCSKHKGIKEKLGRVK